MSGEESLQVLRCHLNKDLIVRALRVCVGINESRELLLGFHGLRDELSYYTGREGRGESAQSQSGHLNACIYAVGGRSYVRQGENYISAGNRS